MRKIELTETAVIVRTDFSNEAGWAELTAAVQEVEEPFIFTMDWMEDPANDGATVEELLKALPEEYPHSFLAIADKKAMAGPDHPILLVDLLEERGREFRAVARQVASIENNLSVGNMGFEEFAENVDESGVFRGFADA